MKLEKHPGWLGAEWKHYSDGNAIDTSEDQARESEEEVEYQGVPLATQHISS